MWRLSPSAKPDFEQRDGRASPIWKTAAWPHLITRQRLQQSGSDSPLRSSVTCGVVGIHLGLYDARQLEGLHSQDLKSFSFAILTPKNTV